MSSVEGLAQSEPCRVDLEGGGFVIVPCSALQKGDLQGVQIQTQINVGNKNLPLEGVIAQGQYSANGIDFEGMLRLVEDFTYKSGAVTATLKTGGTLGVVVEKSKFISADLTGVEAVVSIETGASTPLKLEGTLSNGSYGANDKVDFDASLGLIGDFTYDRGGVTATLKTGGVLVVVVEKSELTTAEFDAIQADLSVKSTGPAPLEVTGAIRGDFNTSGPINCDGMLGLVEDFTYERGPVQVTLKAGGTLAVSVQAGQPEQVTFRGVEVTVCIPIWRWILKLTRYRWIGEIPIAVLGG